MFTFLFLTSIFSLSFSAFSALFLGVLSVTSFDWQIVHSASGLFGLETSRHEWQERDQKGVTSIVFLHHPFFPFDISIGPISC